MYASVCVCVCVCMHACMYVLLKQEGVRRSEREKKKKASNQLGLRRKVSPQKGKPFNHPPFLFLSFSLPHVPFPSFLFLFLFLISLLFRPFFHIFWRLTDNFYFSIFSLGPIFSLGFLSIRVQFEMFFLHLGMSFGSWAENMIWISCFWQWI